MNVVEFRKERDYFPQVLARPTVVKTTKAINDMDLNLVRLILAVVISRSHNYLFVKQHLNNGKVVTKQKKKILFYHKLPSWENHLSKTERFRNHEQVRINLLVEHGEVRSYLADRYPECRQIEFSRKKEDD